MAELFAYLAARHVVLVSADLYDIYVYENINNLFRLTIISRLKISLSVKYTSTTSTYYTVTINNQM